MEVIAKDKRLQFLPPNKEKEKETVIQIEWTLTAKGDKAKLQQLGDVMKKSLQLPLKNLRALGCGMTRGEVKVQGSNPCLWIRGCIKNRQYTGLQKIFREYHHWWTRDLSTSIHDNLDKSSCRLTAMDGHEGKTLGVQAVTLVL